MEDSIFSKIINGDIPCHKVYEDDRVLAFLDIHPIQPGHTLIVPKCQIDHFDELEDADYTALFDAVKKIAQQQKRVFKKQRACVRIEGFDVPHAHVHVYPCDSPADFYGPDNRAFIEPDHDALAKVAEMLSL